MNLETEGKAKVFVKELGALEFIFTTEGVVTFQTQIPDITNDGLLIYEVSFFHEEGTTFYRVESMDAFLSDMQIFEIKKVYQDSNASHILYHRSYNSDVIENDLTCFNLGDYNIMFKFEDKDLKDEEQIESLNKELKEHVKAERFEEADKISKLIKQIKSKL
jgi:hypothetical protein